MIVEQNMHDLLDSRAQGVQSDIRGDHPDMNLDTNYDLWIEDDVMPGADLVYGVIDMGDCYQQVFYWHEDDEQWVETYEHDPQHVIDRIIRKRQHSGF